MAVNKLYCTITVAIFPDNVHGFIFKLPVSPSFGFKNVFLSKDKMTEEKLRGHSA